MAIFALSGSIIFGCITMLTLLVTFGFPLGQYTLGGKYRTLPLTLRIVSAFSFLIQLIGIFAILEAGKIMHTHLFLRMESMICIGFGIYLLINTVMNFISSSNKEKYTMTPLSLFSSICFLIVGILN